MHTLYKHNTSRDKQLNIIPIYYTRHMFTSNHFKDANVPNKTTCRMQYLYPNNLLQSSMRAITVRHILARVVVAITEVTGSSLHLFFKTQ